MRDKVIIAAVVTLCVTVSVAATSVLSLLAGFEFKPAVPAVLSAIVASVSIAANHHWTE